MYWLEATDPFPVIIGFPDAKQLSAVIVHSGQFQTALLSKVVGRLSDLHDGFRVVVFD
nr:hypothetical protein [Providencia rettgeri]